MPTVESLSIRLPTFDETGFLKESVVVSDKGMTWKYGSCPTFSNQFQG